MSQQISQPKAQAQASFLAAESPAYETRSTRKLAPTLERLVVWLLGAFIFFQCFGMPILGVGPWALWPTLADLALWSALALAVLYVGPQRSDLLPLWRILILVTALSAISVLMLFIMQDGRLAQALPFGIFQLFKLLQLLAVFWMVSRLSLNSRLIKRWERAAGLSFFIMVVTIIWTYFDSTIPDTLGQFLPRGKGVSGPWESYYLHHERGLGTLGYNHAYVAAIVLLQGAFLMMLRAGKPHTWILLGIVTACFLSGARAGLVGAVVFLALEAMRTPLRSTLTAMMVGIAGIFAMPFLQADLDDLVERQFTILEAGNVENLAGRSEIWDVYLSNLAQDPMRLLLGSGMGSAVANNGANAHLMLLQVLYETGIAGIIIMGLLFWYLFGHLRARKTERASIAINLLIALWVTTVVTETLYPNSAFGTFLPMLALVLAFALAPSNPKYR